MGGKRKEQSSRGVIDGDNVYELRLRKDGDGFDLISDGFRCGAIWRLFNPPPHLCDSFCK
jgi:hypothetical protein